MLIQYCRDGHQAHGILLFVLEKCIIGLVALHAYDNERALMMMMMMMTMTMTMLRPTHEMSRWNLTTLDCCLKILNLISAER